MAARLKITQIKSKVSEKQYQRDVTSSSATTTRRTAGTSRPSLTW